MRPYFVRLTLAAGADPPDPATTRNMDSAVKVSLGKSVQATGIVVSDQGHILITAVVADACGNCTFVVRPAGPASAAQDATLLTFDRRVGLAIIKTERPVGIPATLEDRSAVSADDGLVIIGVSHADGKIAVRAPIVLASYSDADLAKRGWDPAILAEYFGAFGMIGAGGFNDRTGLLLGVIQGKHTIREKASIKSLTVLTPAWVIRRFLSDNGIPERKE